MIKYDFDKCADRQIDHARKWDRKIVQGKFPKVRTDFIPVWIADMDFQAAPEIREALANVALNGAYGYTYATDEWYDAVLNWQQRRHHNRLERDWLTLGYGTVPNMHYLYQAFLAPDEKVLMNTPVYGPFAYAAEHNGYQIVKNKLKLENKRYTIDFELLAKQLEDDKNKIYLLCSPHNPSGRIWQLSEMQRIAQLCLENDVLLVVDEVHSEHIINGQFYSAFQLPKQYWNQLIVLTSPNKGFNLGGLKLSYSIIPNVKLRKRLRQQYAKNSITSPNVFGQTAMIAAYNQGEEWLNQCEAYIKQNYVDIQAILAESFDGWEMCDMDSSYLPWVNITNTPFTMHEIVDMMANEAGVIFGDGDDYVADGDTFIRLNLGAPNALIKESMTRMAEVWQAHTK